MRIGTIAHIDHGKTTLAKALALMATQQQSVRLRDDQMICPECGSIAESESVDVGVGLYIRGNYECACGWEYEADGRMNVETYNDYFVEAR